MQKNPGYSLINIIGLAVGMTCCMLILMWVYDELSYDRFHKNGDQIYRIVCEDPSSGSARLLAGSPAPLGPELIEKCPGVNNFTRLQCGWTGWYLHYGEKNFMQERLACADPSFFEIFQLPFIRGDSRTALKERHSIVLTERLAKKCFGDQDPIGKVMQITDVDMTVTGVIRDLPHNSHLQFDYIFPIINMTEWRHSKIEDWKYLQFATYIELEKSASVANINANIKNIVKSHLPESKGGIFLQPLHEIHLRSKQMNSWMIRYPNPGDINYVYIFSAIAVCVLLIACINYMNMATARAVTRAKEVGVRKVAGAGRRDLLGQFLGESLFLSLISFILAILLVQILIPYFSMLTGRIFSPDFYFQPVLLGLFVAVLCCTTVLSGAYPAIFFTAFSPIAILKSNIQNTLTRGGGLRKVLVVGQFAFAAVLIILTAVMYRQLHYMQNEDLGYNEKNILHFPGYGEFGTDYPAIKNEMLQNPDILCVGNGFPPTLGMNASKEISWEGQDPTKEFVIYSDIGDYDFKNVFELQMASGRYYSPEFISDTANFVINQTAANMMGLDDPVGKRMTFKGKTGVIIGVVKDYHGGSLREAVLPKLIELHKSGFFILVKYRAGKETEVLQFLETKWKKIMADFPFRYTFFDESIANWYSNEKRVGQIFTQASILAIFIACLGLFGMASFTAERRTKEIGIRKILGASAFGIVSLLCKDFVKWVLLANMIAWPLAYYFSSHWLQGFAYRISLRWDYFIGTMMVTVFITFLTIVYHTIKVASDHPVNALRYE